MPLCVFFFRAGQPRAGSAPKPAGQAARWFLLIKAPLPWPAAGPEFFFLKIGAEAGFGTNLKAGIGADSKDKGQALSPSQLGRPQAPKFFGWKNGSRDHKTLNTKTLNPKARHPKTLNPKTLNPKTLKP